MPLAHEELHEQRRQVEAPVLVAIRQNCPEQPPGTGPAQKVLLVGSFFVGVARREHHALDAQLHHVVEKGAYAFGIGPVKQRSVGGDPEAAAQGFSNGVDRNVITAFAADREVVVLFLPVQVDAEGQVLGGLKKIDLFLEQQSIGAEVD